METAPDTASSPPSWREILAGAYRDRRKIALAAGLTFLAACTLAFVLPAKYPARATLLVLLGSEYTVRPEAGSPAIINDTLGRDQILNSEIGILGSDDLHLEVIRAIGLGQLYPRLLEPPGPVARALDAARALSDAAAVSLGLAPARARPPSPLDLALIAFDRDLDIAPLKDGSVIDVTYRHRDPALAVRAVDTLVSRYLARRQAIYVDAQSAMVADQVAALRRDVDTATARLAAFKAAHGIADFGVQRDLLLRQRDALAAALHETEAAIAQSAGRLAALQKLLVATPAVVTEFSDTDTDARIAAIRTAVQTLQGKRDEMRAHYLPDSRPMQELQAEIGAREAELRQARTDRSASAVRVGRNATYDALDLERAHTLAEVQAQQAHRATLAVQIAALEAAVARLDAEEPALQDLQRQVSVADDNFRATARMLEDRRVMEDVAARRAANVRVIQAARVPARPHDLTALILFAGGLLSLLAAAAAAAAAGQARRGFIGPETLERTLGIPVLASISDFADARRRHKPRRPDRRAG